MKCIEKQNIFINFSLYYVNYNLFVIIIIGAQNIKISFFNLK